MGFQSKIVSLGRVEFPDFSGIRIMMMPFLLNDVTSLPERVGEHDVGRYRRLVRNVIAKVDANKLGQVHGVGYLTIDEAFVREGETHRRPGLHVDGTGPDGKAGAWGGGGGWAANGMAVASSHSASRAWNQTFAGEPGPNGDCVHLADQLDPAREVVLCENVAYWCGSLAVHETLPANIPMHRAFLRVSLPSDAPWYEGYTENPNGIRPTGSILEPRTKFMEFRAELEATRQFTGC